MIGKEHPSSLNGLGECTPFHIGIWSLISVTGSLGVAVSHTAGAHFQSDQGGPGSRDDRHRSPPDALPGGEAAPTSGAGIASHHSTSESNILPQPLPLSGVLVLLIAFLPLLQYNLA